VVLHVEVLFYVLFPTSTEEHAVRDLLMRLTPAIAIAWKKPLTSVCFLYLYLEFISTFVAVKHFDDISITSPDFTEIGKKVTESHPNPLIIHDYNHNIDHVDFADQLRGCDPWLRRIRRGGRRALWGFLYNIVLTTSYLLTSPHGYVGSRTEKQHKKGQLKLWSKSISKLFELAKGSIVTAQTLLSQCINVTLICIAPPERI